MVDVSHKKKTLRVARAQAEVVVSMTTLDLIQNNLIKRNIASVATREYLNNNNFVEIETPYLFKSTPEGARDFLVPSRLQAGKFGATKKMVMLR